MRGFIQALAHYGLKNCSDVNRFIVLVGWVEKGGGEVLSSQPQRKMPQFLYSQVKKLELCLCFYLTLLWYESECILLSIFLFKQHFSFTTQEIISDDDDDEEFNIPLSSSVKKTKTTQ